MAPLRVSMREVLIGVEQSALQMLPASVRLAFEPPAEDMHIETDPEQLIAVVVQLVANAREAMPDGGTIRVRLRAESVMAGQPLPDGTLLAAGTYAAIEITDSGPGIPPETVGRVTDPFFTTKPTGLGSGMGLAIAVGFARQSGGGLRIRSTPTGTSVTLLVPLLAESRLRRRSRPSSATPVGSA